MTQATLVLPFRGSEVLLAMKKRGFGAGRWNGMGGKVRAGETVIDAAIRETQEEVGITPHLGEPLGSITFHNSSKGDWVVRVFRADSWKGEPIETEEMRPEWFPLDAIPFESMWPDDKHWMPYVISNKRFNGEFWFAKQDNTFAKFELKEIPS